MPSILYGLLLSVQSGNSAHVARGDGYRDALNSLTKGSVGEGYALFMHPAAFNMIVYSPDMDCSKIA